MTALFIVGLVASLVLGMFLGHKMEFRASRMGTAGSALVMVVAYLVALSSSLLWAEVASVYVAASALGCLGWLIYPRVVAPREYARLEQLMDEERRSRSDLDGSGRAQPRE